MQSTPYSRRGSFLFWCLPRVPVVSLCVCARGWMDGLGVLGFCCEGLWFERCDGYKRMIEEDGEGMELFLLWALGFERPVLGKE